jgi:hypothetical protein
MPEDILSDDAVGLVSDGPAVPLQTSDFTSKGELIDVSGELSLVVTSAQAARDFLNNKQ